MRDRCSAGDISAKYYYDKGIKCLITIEQLKEIWIRDNADSMKRPSIDRIDSNGHYEPDNCRFIELSDNIKRAVTGKGKRAPYTKKQSIKGRKGTKITYRNKVFPSKTAAAIHFKCCDSTINNWLKSGKLHLYH